MVITGHLRGDQPHGCNFSNENSTFRWKEYFEWAYHLVESRVARGRVILIAKRKERKQGTCLNVMQHEWPEDKALTIQQHTRSRVYATTINQDKTSRRFSSRQRD